MLTFEAESQALMGRKGWGGAAPADDDEARKRIVDAALRVMDRRGAGQTTVAGVADALGISRRTVYNYFGSTQELFTAVAQVALQGFVADVKDIVVGMDVTAQLVEVVAYCVERLPREPQLALLLANDSADSVSRSIVAPSRIARCREILQLAQIDWPALGYDDQTFDELAEFILRIIQSMVVAPSDPPRSGAELRAYLRRWIGPALA